jgi:hypothetical protein
VDVEKLNLNEAPYVCVGYLHKNGTWCTLNTNKSNQSSEKKDTKPVWDFAVTIPIEDSSRDIEYMLYDEGCS